MSVTVGTYFEIYFSKKKKIKNKEGIKIILLLGYYIKRKEEGKIKKAGPLRSYCFYDVFI